MLRLLPLLTGYVYWILSSSYSSQQLLRILIHIYVINYILKEMERK